MFMWLSSVEHRGSRQVWSSIWTQHCELQKVERQLFIPLRTCPCCWVWFEWLMLSVDCCNYTQLCILAFWRSSSVRHMSSIDSLCWLDNIKNIFYPGISGTATADYSKHAVHQWQAWSFSLQAELGLLEWYHMPWFSCCKGILGLGAGQTVAQQ